MDNPKQSFWQYIDQFKIPIALSLVGVVLILGGIFASSQKPQTKNFPKESLIEAQKTISVDVSGAVQKPGVYKLQEGSRVEDAIKLAGGILEDSNKEYVSKYLNLALKLTDGSKVYVPFAGETQFPNTQGQGGVAGVATKVNINTSSQAELEALPGIGPVTASKIISDRPYQKIEDLVDKKIVSKSVFEKIKDSITIY